MQNLLYYLLQIYFITPSNSKYFDLKNSNRKNNFT